MNEKPTGLYCLAQHFATWYKSFRDDDILDFAEPCAVCAYREYCGSRGFPWADLILPVLADQGIYVSMNHQNLHSERRLNDAQKDAASG